VDLRRLQLSLVAAQLVGAATLLRSIAYDRWITVLASVLLIVGASAARRGRSWGVGLSLGAAAAFPVAWLIGIAPPWFCLVGIVGALPFAIASRAFARFDKGATVLLAFLAASAGAIGAIAWKQFAWSIFTTFPASRPSLEAQHGFALAAITALVAVVALTSRSRRVSSSAEGVERIRIGEQVRIAKANEDALDGDAAFEEEHTDDGIYVGPAERRRRMS
jgi:hypothetical protein